MLRADVPVGSYLSGGLDSSLVAALGRRVKGERFSTFSIRFEDAEYDETAFQREVVRLVESDHHEITVGRRDIAEAFPAVVAHAERPLLRTAPAPLYLLSRLVREAGIKVVLTGEGADEMFGGYDLFREGKVRRFWGRQPASARPAAPAGAALPVPGPLAGGPAGPGPRVLRPRPGALAGAGLRPPDPLAGHRRAAAPLHAGAPARGWTGWT